MRPLSLAALLLALALLACGGGDPGKLTDEGVQALNAGKPAEALAKLDQALAGLQPATPEWHRATVERLRALAASEPARAASESERIAREHPAALEAQDFETIARALQAKRAFAEATAVLQVGIQQHPESPKLAALVQEIGDAAASAGDSKALDALRGLGYAGDQ